MERPHGLLRLHRLFGSQRSSSDLQGQTPSARHRTLKKGLSPRWLYRSVVANAATARVAPVTRVVRIAAICLRLAGTAPDRSMQNSVEGSVPNGTVELAGSTIWSLIARVTDVNFCDLRLIWIEEVRFWYCFESSGRTRRKMC